MDVDVELAPVTLDRLDRLCQVQDVHLDDVLGMEAEMPFYAGTELAVLAVVAPEHEVPVLRADDVGRAAGRLWMRLAHQQLVVASSRAKRYADRCGVWELMQERGGGSSLARVVTRYDPAAHRALWHEMELVESLSYLLLKSVDELTENLDDYL
jgi:hypothetical protein